MSSTTPKTNANPKQAFGDKKPPLALLPLVAHIHGAMAFYDGAGKYGKYNWRENPVEADTYVQALLRHARLWENGEEFARDTGVHNLGGVIACAALLLDAQANGVLIDNRVKSQAACDLLHESEGLVASLKVQHAERKAMIDTVDEAKETERQRVEENKRHQAQDAVQVLLQLYQQSLKDPSDSVLSRLRGSEDVLLNMVNGVFPEDPAKDVKPQRDEMEFPEVCCGEMGMEYNSLCKDCPLRIENFDSTRPDRFSLMEALTDGLSAAGYERYANHLRARFARGTGGMDKDFLVKEVSYIIKYHE